MLMQGVECGGHVPSYINQTLPSGLGKVLVSIIWSIQKVYALPSNSRHQEAHCLPLTKEQFLWPCRDPTNVGQLCRDLNSQLVTMILVRQAMLMVYFRNQVVSSNDCMRCALSSGTPNLLTQDYAIAMFIQEHLCNSAKPTSQSGHHPHAP